MARGELRFKLLLALTSGLLTAIVAVAAGEVYIRATGSAASPEKLREASLEYEPTLFARHAFPRVAQRKRPAVGNVEINERGYRGPAFAVPKPRGVVRLVVLGGSAAFDLHAFEGRDWPRLVEAKLRGRGYSQLEVVNAATPGHATWDSLGRLYSEIWTLEPDYVLVYHAWNDIKYFRWLSSERTLLRGFRPARPGPTTEGFVLNPFLYYSGPVDRALGRSHLYAALRARYLAWSLGVQGQEGLGQDGDPGQPASAATADRYDSWGPRQYELNLRSIAEVARHVGAKPIFVTQARLVAASNRDSERQRIAYRYVSLTHDALVRAFADCDRAMMAAAAATHTAVLDLAPLVGRDDLFTDHVHTNPKGSEAIADAVAAFVSRVLDADGPRARGA